MSSQAIRPGVHVSRELRLEARRGAGGMGEVWRARDLELDRDVALKLLFPAAPSDKDDATDEFVRSRREARACARVLHPNVVAVYGVGEFAGRPWIAMEWVDGPTLRETLADARSRHGAEIIGWITAIGNAVQHAHDRGVLHCDLKPENILMQRLPGGGLRPRLVDFGLARGPNLVHRKPTQQRGTRAYLAPEAGLLRPSPAADQYSLAVTFCELLGGARPARGRGRLELPANVRITAEAGVVLKRALHRDARRRYPDVAGFVRELLAALGGPRPSRKRGRSTRTDLEGLGDGEEITESWLAGLTRGQLRRAVLGIVATAPAGFPEAVARVARVRGVGDALADLEQQEMIEGSLGAWKLRDPRLRPMLLDALPGPVTRAIAVRIAEALVEEAGTRSWMLDEAVRLYVGAGRLDRAAELLRFRGRTALRARDHDRRLAEAAALVASPERGARWLAVLLERLRWCVDCGRTEGARRLLVHVQGVAADIDLPPDGSEAVAIATADGELRMQAGTPGRALERLRRVHPEPETDGEHAHAAATVRALVELERLAEAAGLLDARGDAPDGCRLLSARARLLVARGRGRRAATMLRRALARALDDHHELLAAMAAVELAETLVALGQPGEAAAVADDAGELLALAGRLRWSGRIAAVRASLALAQGDGFEAMRAARTALDTAIAHGTIADEHATAHLMVEICTRLGDRAGALRFAGG